MKLLGDNHRKMNIFLCEDNREQLSYLYKTIKTVATNKRWDVILKAYESAEDMLEELVENPKGITVDVVFADIEMPGMNGIELGKIVNGKFPDSYFIFTTAFSEYAVEGYEARAYRYLLKPVTEEKVTRVLEGIVKERGRNKSLLLKEQGEDVLVSIRDIVYISAEDKYTVFHTDTAYFLDKISMKECESLLESYGFYRIHRKYIVNMRYHKKLGKGKLELSGEIKLPVSRSRQQSYEQCFMELLEKGFLDR